MHGGTTSSKLAKKTQLKSLKLLSLCLSLPALLCLIGCTEQSSTFQFRYTHEQPAASLRSQSMLFFEKALERRSNGRIEVELYFSGVLGSERESMDFLSMGIIQGHRGGFFADANPKYKLFTLPFLVDNWDQATQLIRSPFTARINQEAAVRGFHIPATGISQGFRAHTNSKHPINHPNDIKGLKMRVPSQEVYVQTALAFGANPQEIPAVEIYQSLQTGVVDGQDNPPANIWDYKIHEVSEFLTITHYSTGPDPLMVNLKWYNSLPDDLKKIFDEVATDAMRLSDKLNRDKEADYIDKLKNKLSVNVVEGEQLKPFRAAVKPVYDYFIAQGDFSAADIEEARKAAQGREVVF